MATATPSPEHGPDESREPAGSAAFADQVALLAELLDAEPAELTEGEVVDGVVALAKLSGQVDAALGSLVGALDTRAIHTTDGAPSAASWVAGRTELTRQHAGAVAARQRDLRACPHVAEAHRLGLIGTAKVRILLAARERVEEIFAQHEAELVRSLRPLRVDHARFAAARWRRLALATVGLDEDTAPTDPAANALHLSATSGRCELSGNLDLVTGSRAAAAFDAEIATLFRTGRFTSDDGLLRSQRQAIALDSIIARATAVPADAVPTGPAPTGVGAETVPASAPAEADRTDSAHVREAADGGDPAGGARTGSAHPDSAASAASDPAGGPAPAGPAAAVQVVVDARLLLGLLEDGDDGAGALDRRCELADGTPLPLSTVERLLCGATVQPVLTRTGLDGIFDAAAVPSPSRTVTRTQQRALAHRDLGCVFPGCAATPARCDAHHVVPWARGGATAIHNLVLLCGRHHHAVHEGGFTLTFTGGTVTVSRPDGTIVARTRHGDQVVEPVDDDARHGPHRSRSRFRPLTDRLTPDERLARSWRRDGRTRTLHTRLGFSPPAQLTAGDHHIEVVTLASLDAAA